METKNNMLEDNRFFDSDPVIRGIANELYNSVKGLPIVSPHGHVDPGLLAENNPFPDPADLFIIPDHYIFRLLYSQGIALESLGIPAADGTAVEKDRRRIWQIFADNYYLYAGTPTSCWLRHVFVKVFDIHEKLCKKNAMEIYDNIQEKLNRPEFLPRALFDRFNIEVLTTTDRVSDSLEHHSAIAASDWNGRVLPCFRPDSAVKITAPGWKGEIDKLSEVTGIDINSYKTFIQAIENRRSFFKTKGAVSTDQGVFSPYTEKLVDSHANAIFQRALENKAGMEDENLFTANMLMEMARMSIEDGLVMQIHPGSHRNHNGAVFEKFGADKGCDIPVQTEYTKNLYEHDTLKKHQQM